MRKILPFLLVAGLYGQTTPHLGLNVPITGTVNWGTLLNANSYTLDALATGYTSGWLIWPLTTKGDLYVYDTQPTRLAATTDGFVLTLDSTTQKGMKWAAAAGGLSYPPGTGIPSVSSGAAWGSTYGTTGSGGNVVLSIGPTLVAPLLGTPAQLNLNNAVNLPASVIVGTNSIPFASLPFSTTGHIGAVKPDGTTVTVDTDGTIHAPTSGLPAQTGIAGYLTTNGTTPSWGNITTGASGALDCSTTPGTCDITSIVPLKARTITAGLHS